LWVDDDDRIRRLIERWEGEEVTLEFYDFDADLRTDHRADVTVMPAVRPKLWNLQLEMAWAITSR
jgi:hypothetical protein